MKKVLFATTALVASAGIASAQGVELSGSAEMGIFGGSDTDTQFHTDIDVTFTMSGETDNGLTFGASIDLDEEGGFGNTNGGPEAVFISGSFGTLTMGDTDGAFDWALTEVAVGGGSIDDDHTGHGGYNGNAGLDGVVYDGQVARYDYAFGDFAFAASVEIDDNGVGDPVFGIGANYSGDLGGITVGVGVGYQTGGTGNEEAFGGSLTAALSSGFEARANYSQVTRPRDDGVQTDHIHIGVGVGYSMDAISIGANYGTMDIGGETRDGFGVAASYDLGGGAVVQAAYGSTLSTGGDSTFSLGVAMSF